MAEEQKKGWCGCLAVGCLIVIVALVAGGYYAYVKTLEVGRNFAAEALIAAVDGVAKANLDQAEQEQIMQPVRELARKIREGKVTLKQAGDLGKAFLVSPLIPAMVTFAFQKQYINSPEMPEVEQEAAKMIISRFTRGICDGAIPAEQINAVMDTISEETIKDGRKTKTIKPKLTPEELQNCLTLMKKSADDGGIENKTFTLDLTKEIQTVIDQGMSGNVPVATATKPAEKALGVKKEPQAELDPQTQKDLNKPKEITKP